MFQFNYAFEFVRSIRAGWNLGNTFDCIIKPEQMRDDLTPTDFETAWGNIPVNRGQLEAVRDAGFDALRIPVTWGQHLSPAPEYRIDEQWIRRIEAIVREAFSLGFRVILNVHHDAAPHGEISLLPEHLDESERILCCLWEQIAEHFADLGESLIFEVMNEPHITDDWTGNPALYAAVNRLNAAAVRTIRSKGGCNCYRYLMIPTYAATYKTAALNALEIPEDERIIVSIHPYFPTEFCFPRREVAWAVPQETWGSKSDIDNLLSVFHQIGKHFTSRGIPVILSEMAAVGKQDSRSRLLWTAVYAKEASDRGIPCFWWDNGQTGEEHMGIFDRKAMKFTDPEIASVLTGRTVE